MRRSSAANAALKARPTCSVVPWVAAGSGIPSALSSADLARLDRSPWRIDARGLLPCRRQFTQNVAFRLLEGCSRDILIRADLSSQFD
jgi:hypothetical protein